VTSSTTLDTQAMSSGSFAARAIESGRSTLLRYCFIALVLVGVLLRVLIALLAGNGIRTPWGGGGDTQAYVLLAHNLIDGHGYAYAGEPTALRAPAYPLLLAGSLKLFGNYALAGMRWLQFGEGLTTVLLCAAIARRIFDARAAKAVLLVSLFFPTLAIMNGEILSEATATFLSTLFLYLMIRYVQESSWLTLTALSVTIGLAALTRFNMALLGGVAIVACLFAIGALPKWRAIAWVFLVSVLVVSPWLIRNEVVFHGQVLFSTHAGIDAVEGVLTPQGRALAGDSERLRDALGWVAPEEAETNSPNRHLLPPEPTLDRNAWKVALGLWRRESWALVPLELKKLSYFWLSADQLLSTEGFPIRGRIFRGAAVVFYWALLALAVVGWLQLRKQNPTVASLFLTYAVLVTTLHLPFVMNTRLRMPFLDAWIAVLAGAAMAQFPGIKNERRLAQEPLTGIAS
jgi:4-amino-4-deoxy-L-arabinose transferase-like glycosyltransferase